MLRELVQLAGTLHYICRVAGVRIPVITFIQILTTRLFDKKINIEYLTL
jgi:hypothetical protein